MTSGRQFKHYYYMLELDISSESLDTEQLQYYKQIIKATSDKKLITSVHGNDEKLSIHISGVYLLYIKISIKDETLADVDYTVYGNGITYYDDGKTHIYFDDNHEGIIIIPLGSDKTLLMLHYLETI